MLPFEEQDVGNIDVVASYVITPNKEWNFFLLRSFSANDLCILIKSIPIPSHNIEGSFVRIIC